MSLYYVILNSFWTILPHMVQRRKLTTAVVIGIAVLIPVVFVVFLELYSFVIYTPSNIVDFHPSNFEAKADANFFYSIGDDLKYFNEMTPQPPTLMRGHIKNFLVSPDNKKIAVVSNGLLLVVAIEEPVIRKVASVDSVFSAKLIGKQFFRDTGFQW